MLIQLFSLVDSRIATFTAGSSLIYRIAGFAAGLFQTRQLEFGRGRRSRGRREEHDRVNEQSDRNGK